MSETSSVNRQNNDNEEGDYIGVVAELYDLWFPATAEGYEDEAFFQRRIVEAGGHALEVACGTGRLLLPFLQAGLLVEGVDISTEMLERCRQKAAALGLRPVLYQQFMQELDLPKLYRTIYLPFCSFQYLQDRADAQEALRRFHRFLEPGGKLFVSMYIPWEDLGAKNEWKLRRVATRPKDGATVLMHEATKCDRTDQVQTDFYKYEVYVDGRLVRTDLRSMKLRWYYKHEFELMARAAGFGDFTAYHDYSDDPATDGCESMVFCATK